MAPLLSGTDFTTLTSQTVPDLTLQLASGVVQAYCGWNIAQETVTANVDSDGSSVLLLPSLYLTAVTTLTLNGTAPDGSAWPTLAEGTDWDWQQNGVLTWLRDACGWPAGGQRVNVTYTSGYATVPDGVQMIVASVAQRLAAGSVIQSHLQNIGGISQNVTYGQSVTAGAGVTAYEAAVLDRYRIGHIA